MKRISIKQVWAMFLAITCILLNLAGPGIAECRHTYTIRISAGTQGLIDGQESVVYIGLNYGDRVNFNLRDVILKDGSKYYIKGVRPAGRDNNTSYAASSFLVAGDADYVIAYGLLTDAVAYTVEYVDSNGRVLAPAETYYGNVGDKPVVAFLYIEGYKPNAYNLTRTLKSDASKNIFRFTYTKVQTPAPEMPGQPGQPERPGSPEQSGGQMPGSENDTNTGGQGNTNTGGNTGGGAGNQQGAGQGNANAGNETDNDNNAGGDGTPNINPGGIPVIPAENQEPDNNPAWDGNDDGNDNSVPNNNDVNLPDDGPGDNTGNNGGVPDGEPEELIDIDDEQTPLAGFTTVIGEAKLLGIPVWIEILFGAAVLGAGGYFGYRYYKRRQEEG